MNQIYIFSEKRSNRLVYMARTIADRLGVLVEITSDNDILVTDDKAVINYSNIEAGKLQITPAGLLFEKRIQDQELAVSKTGGVSLLYSNRDTLLGHDVIAACFYLLSRYEEYLPHRKDDHGRFASTSSVLSEIASIQTPLVDIYLKRLKNALQEIYPWLIMRNEAFRIEVTVDVDQLFLYESKGIARSIIGTMKDSLINTKSLVRRLDVNLGGKQDPLNIYHALISKVGAFGINPRFFFQVGEPSRFDSNNPVHLPKVHDLINEISLRADIGLHPSYFSSDNHETFLLEHERLKKVTNQEVQHSRQHYLKFELPKTYRWLENEGITHDYSMGFADANGFRAGTAVPFKFYDLGREESTGLTIHPLIFMDMLTVRKYSNEVDSRTELDTITNAIKENGGLLNTTWHPEVLIGFDVPQASDGLLDYCLETYSHVTPE